MWAAVLPVAAATACFTGADAQGLPCRSVLDCGQGQSCQDGFCGGPPATSGGGSSTTAVSSNDGASESSTGGRPVCGNGVVEPEGGETCDPGTGVDGPVCNADCTQAVCGDGYANEVARERCDDGNDSNMDECTSDCTRTLFWDDMSRGPMETMKWMLRNRTHTFMGEEEYGLSEVDYGWQWNMPPGMWSSGLYSQQEGTSGIITAPIEFPPAPGPGFRFELRFRHRYRFDGNPIDVDIPPTECPELNNPPPDNPDNDTYDDGAIVWIVEDGEVLQVAAPVPESSGARPLGNESRCGVENPMNAPNPLLLDDLEASPPAFAGRIDEFTDVRFPLPPDLGGRTVRLLFEVGYDCFNCWGGSAPMNAGWTIDDVVVAAFPM